MPNKVENLKPFTKGDPRINRKGRPKSFDALRQLAQSLANAQAKDSNGNPLVLDDGSAATQTQVILLKLMRENPEKFLEIAFGKVPQAVDVTSGGEKIELVVRYADDNKPTPTP